MQELQAGEEKGFTSTNVGDQVSDALLLKELGEQAGPVGLHRHTRCLGHCADVLGL